MPPAKQAQAGAAPHTAIGAVAGEVAVLVAQVAHRMGALGLEVIETAIVASPPARPGASGLATRLTTQSQPFGRLNSINWLHAARQYELF